MATPVRVEVVGDTASMQAEIGSATATLKFFGDTSEVAFGQYVSSAERAMLASDKLAVSLAKAPAGSSAATAALATYEKELVAIQRQQEATAAGAQALQARQLSAAKEIGASLTKYVTAPAILVGVAALKMGTDFDAAMTRIETQAGAGAGEVARLEGKVLDLAKDGAQQGPTQLAEGLYHLESLGLRGSKAIDALKVSSDAAALGEANLADITTALGGVIVTGIKGSSDFQKTMGTLDATIGAGNMSMSDLVGFLSTGVVPAAKAAGISLDELGAMLAVMTDRGVPAEMAGTRIRMSLALLTNQTPKAAKALADLGIDADTMAKTLQEPGGVLKVLQMLHDGIASVGKVQGNKDLLTFAGGGRTGAGIQMLVESLLSSTSSYQGKFAQIFDQHGRLAQKEQEQQSTAAAHFHEDIAKMEADLVGLGNAMLPTVTTVVDGVTKIGDAFGDLPGPIKDDLGVIVATLAIGGPLLLGIAFAKKMIRSLGDAFAPLPVKAGIAVTETDAEIAAIGSTAETSAAKVDTLKGSLAGIAGKAFVATLILDLVPHSNAGKTVLDKVFGSTVGNALAGLPGIGGLDTQAADVAANIGAAITGNSIIPSGPSSTTEYDALVKKATAGGGRKRTLTSDDVEDISAITLAQIVKLKPYFASNKDYQLVADQKISSLKLNPAVTAQDIQWFSDGLTPKQINDLNTQLEKFRGYGGTTSPSSAPVGSGSKPKPLTKDQKLQLGLAADPNNVALLQEQADEIRTQLAKLNQLRQEGRINNVTYTARAKEYNDELTTTLQQIAEIENAAATAQEQARQKATAAAQKRLDASRARLNAHLDVRGTAPAGPFSAAIVARNRSQISARLSHPLGGEYAGPSDYQTPELIQLAEARDQALQNQKGILDDARRAKAAAEKALASGRLSMQAQIDAWNEIDQANQTLGTSTAAGAYKTVSAIKLTAGIAFASTADRKAQEMKIAQAMAHGGKVPVGQGGADGQPIVIHLHSTTELDGREVGKSVTKYQRRAAKSMPAQRSGRYAGSH